MPLPGDGIKGQCPVAGEPPEGYNHFMTTSEAHTPLILHLPDEAATARLGAALAKCLHPGAVVALVGDLGAGKSALSRAAIRAATGDPDEEVPSPTFTLVQTYDTDDGPWFHFDLYRLESPDDALELGIDDAFAEGVSLIEWPDRLGPYLPRHAIRLRLTIVENGARRCEIFAPPSLVSTLSESLDT